MSIDKDELREQLREILIELRAEADQGPTLDQKIEQAETPAELNSIMANAARDAASGPEPEGVAPIANAEELAKRQSAYDQALDAIDDPIELNEFFQANFAEAHELAAAQNRLQAEIDDEQIEAIKNAESVAELQELTGSAPQSHESYLRERFAEPEEGSE